MLKFRIISVLCVILMLFAAFPAAAPAADSTERLRGGTVALYIGSENALVNGDLTSIDKDNANVKTIVKDNRAFVPVRFVAENLGADVKWNENTRAVSITLNGSTILLTIDKPAMSVNGKDYVLDTAPFISESRAYLPLRAVSEALGKEVFYNNGLVIISSQKDIFDPNADSDTINEIINKINNLPVVGDLNNLKKLIGSEGAGPDIYYFSDAAKSAETAPAVSASGPQVSAGFDSGSSVAPEYSRTNVQVEGVDEADVIKTDGEYIYKVNSGGVVIAKAYPPEEMKVASRLEYQDGFTPSEVYVDSNKLVVIGQSYNYQPFYSDSAAQPDISAGSAAKPMIMPRSSGQVVKAIIYDVSDKTKPVKTREIEVEGNYLSSRKIGSCLYFVTNKSLYLYGDYKEEQVVPYYRDSGKQGVSQSVPLSEIRYFPGFTDKNYLITAGVDIDNAGIPVQVSAYLGAGNNIYVSPDNMYVAVNKYRIYTIRPFAGTAEKPAAQPAVQPSDGQTTTVYKFSLKDGQVTFLSKGDVPGRILNQFSMDESDGYFRIATTTDMWSSEMKNNLYVLDTAMNIAGSIEGIAPGEKIYSVRFMGARAYMVTFQTIDPLFVIDLSQPSQPKILGKLKIPGYSDYLHPYDDNHIVGFGKDTYVTKDNRALYLGIKMAMFDVSDVKNPKELYSEKIGDRGTDSPLLYNHKALLFSKEKGLLAFPVTVMTVDGQKIDQNGYPNYGKFTFQGLYVYNIGLDTGFKLAGTITHLSKDDYLKAGDFGGDGTKFIERALYIGDNIYTASPSYIAANSIDGLQQKGMLDITKK